MPLGSTDAILLTRGKPEPDNGGPLVRSLSGFSTLDDSEREAMEMLSRGMSRKFNARRDIIREGDRPRTAFLIQSGWACRYKALADGRRQIIAILIPGDICDLNIDLIRALDHSIATLTQLTITELMPDRLRNAMCQHPRLIEAFYWREMVSAAIQREWALNLGQRSAFERVGHLICELFLRFRDIGLAEGNSIGFPLTQADLADATGLTPVHVNRMVKELREADLIRLQFKTLTIPDLDALKAAALFSDTYLHLGQKDLPRSAFGWD